MNPGATGRTSLERFFFFSFQIDLSPPLPISITLPSIPLLHILSCLVKQLRWSSGLLVDPLMRQAQNKKQKLEKKSKSNGVLKEISVPYSYFVL